MNPNIDIFTAHRRPTGRRRDSITVRFWQKVSKAGPDECWEWTASVGSHGYGQINEGGRGRPLTAHRLSWLIHNGPIPDGLFVCHHCDNRSCVNPAHMFLGTAKDNSMDMFAKGRHPGPPPSKPGRKCVRKKPLPPLATHCKRGHEYTPDNTGHWRNQRFCKTCRRMWRPK